MNLKKSQEWNGDSEKISFSVEDIFTEKTFYIICNTYTSYNPKYTQSHFLSFKKKNQNS